MFHHIVMETRTFLDNFKSKILLRIIPAFRIYSGTMTEMSKSISSVGFLFFEDQVKS